MRTVGALVACLLLGGCGLVPPSMDRAKVEANGRRVQELADLMVAAVRDYTGHAGDSRQWGGGWQECDTAAGHRLRYSATASFGVAADDYERYQVLKAMRSSGWRLSSVSDGASLVFDIHDRGIEAGMRLEDDFASLHAETRCMWVSADLSRRLLAERGH